MSAALPLSLPLATYQDAGTKPVNPPRAELGQNLTGREEGFACFGLIFTVLSDQGCLFLGSTRVLGLGDADDMHHLIVGANGVLDNSLGLGVVDAALLIIAALRLAWVCLTLALDDIIVGRATLGYKISACMRGRRWIASVTYQRLRCQRPKATHVVMGGFAARWIFGCP